jgi:hypothetical protein
MNDGSNLVSIVAGQRMAAIEDAFDDVVRTIEPLSSTEKLDLIARVICVIDGEMHPGLVQTTMTIVEQAVAPSEAACRETAARCDDSPRSGLR